MQPNASYFESLAAKCTPISHTAQEKGFFDIENTDELNSFDDALRSMRKQTCMLFVDEGGEFNDSTSANHTDSIEIQLYILKLKHNNNTILQLNQDAKSLLLEIVKRVRSDFRNDTKHRFTVNNMPYQKVGPMGSDESQWYGYTTILRFACPFATALNSSIWTDI